MLLLTFSTFLAIHAGLVQSLYEFKPLQAVQQRRSQNEQALNLFVTPALSATDCNKKVEQMAISSFTFYRGSNQLFFRDMALEGIVSNSAFNDRRAYTWIQGDMHLLNAGRFDNDQGTVVYDVNDFDEAFVASYLYDVHRLASSIVLVARNKSMTDKDAGKCVAAFVKSYCHQLKSLADGAKPFTYTYKYVKDTEGLLLDIMTDKDGVELGGDKQAKRLRKKMLDKWAPVVRDGEKKIRRFNISPEFEDLQSVTTIEEDAITSAMEVYYTNTMAYKLYGNTEYFTILDMARRKNAGTGSLGISRFYVLIRGESSDINDSRILDVKKQSKPAVYEYLTDEIRARVDSKAGNDANRSVAAYTSLVNHADDHLGFMEMLNGFYSVRERSPYKKSLDLTDVNKAQLLLLSKQYGILLANAHTRSSKGNEAFGVDPNFASIVYGKTKDRRKDFVKEVKGSALAYASEVHRDYDLFLSSQRDGRLCGSAPAVPLQPVVDQEL